MKWVFGFSLVLVTLYLAGLVLVYTQQRDLMYFPPTNYLSPVDVSLETAVEIPIQSETGDALLAWWIGPQDGKPVVMFFHGNGSAVYSNHDIYRELSAKGYGVLGTAYPGYPGSEGTPTEAALVAAAQAQYDYMIDQGVSADNIVFYGTSLGAGVAAQLSKTHKPSLVIMEAPFTSALDMARTMIKIYPVSLFMKDKFLSERALKGSGIPLLWLHGTNDTIIPHTMGQQLFENYDGPKTPHVIEGGQHNNLWFLGGREIILEALASQ